MVTDQQLVEPNSEGARRLRSIGKYQLVARLGQGGMATVYLALVAGPGGFNKLMVVKVLRDDLMGGSEEAVKMFWNEARLAAQLVHPNIVHTYEVGQIDACYFLAMEYLEGQTLRAVQHRAMTHEGIPLNESLRILAEAARGLHYSHGLKSFKGEPLGVVHRDVSPQNVMLTYDGQVKVLDFGIAKMRGAEQMTQAGMIKGKLEYVAPEQLRGEALDGRTDVFPLGAMLWEALTGERFAGGHKVSEITKIHARLTAGERKLRALKPDVPEALAQIVDRAIAIDPSERFESAAAFASALEAYLATQPTRPGASSLSAFLEPLFAADRARIHQLIDDQIERSKTGTGQLPQIGTDPASVSMSGVFVSEGTSTGRTGPKEALPTATPKKRKQTLMWVSIGVAVVVGASIALLPRRRDEAHAIAPADQPREAPSDSAPSSLPGAAAITPAVPATDESAARSVLLEVTVTPATAKVSMDGAPLSTPFRGRFQKSDSLHMIEAFAEGYRPFKRLVPFDANQALAIVLEAAPVQQPSRRPARASSSERQRAEQAAPPVSPSPPAASKPEEPEPGGKMAPGGSGMRRRLIVNDPYAND